MRRLLLFPLLLGAAARAGTVSATPANWDQVQGLAAQPGAGTLEIELAGGTYPLAHALKVQGRGLILRAASGAAPLLLGGAGHFSAVSVEGAPAVRIEGIHFRHFDLAVILRRDGGVRLENDWFDDVHTAVVGEELSGAVLTRNRIDQAGGTPIVLRGGENDAVSDNLIFEYLRSADGGAGILVDGEKAPVLAGNLLYDQFGPGAALWARRCSAVKVTGNAVLDAYPFNWRSDENRGLTVTGNHWQQGGPAGNHLITLAEQARAVLLAAGPDRGAREAMAAAEPAPERPGVCTQVIAWAADRSALVSWRPPRFDGGDPILAYAILASTGQSVTVSAAHFRSEGFARLDGLANGKPCTFIVTAISKAGRGDASAPGAAVVPHLIRPLAPLAPRILGVTRDGGMACVRFAAPSGDGGARITSYVLTILPLKTRVVFSGRNIMRLRPNEATFGVVDELAQDGLYGFTLAAANSAGESKPAVLPP